MHQIYLNPTCHGGLMSTYITRICLWFVNSSTPRSEGIANQMETNRITETIDEGEHYESSESQNSLLVNEIAPRVHNSGHWTQQGADTCQFENHMRAVCQLPLGSTALVRPTAMINILGADSVPNSILDIPSVTIHWYGKTKRAGRKMGHINVCGQDRIELINRLTQLAEILPKEDFPDVGEYINSL